jgi:hypothetical protein
VYTLYKHSRQKSTEHKFVTFLFFQGKWQAVPHDTWGRVSYTVADNKVVSGCRLDVVLPCILANCPIGAAGLAIYC